LALDDVLHEIGPQALGSCDVCRSLIEAEQLERVHEILLGDYMTAYLGGVCIRDRPCAALGSRPKVDDEHRDHDAEQDINEQRSRMLPHDTEHGGGDYLGSARDARRGKKPKISGIFLRISICYDMQEEHLGCLEALQAARRQTFF